MFVRMMVAALTVFSIQSVNAVVEGDQSGLLAALYSAKTDYHNLVTKGSLENGDLSRMLRNIEGGLRPYENREVMLTSSWSAPIWATVNDFRAEFSAENAGIADVFAGMDLTAQQLRDEKRVECSFIDARFQAVRQDMHHVWEDRQLDSELVIAKLEELAMLADRVNGPYYVSTRWLNGIRNSADASMVRQNQYTREFYEVNTRLDQLINEVRTCYDID